jgi:hypothetical protein
MIKPYSIAVAPRWSLIRRAKSLNIRALHDWALQRRSRNQAIRGASAGGIG